MNLKEFEVRVNGQLHSVLNRETAKQAEQAVFASLLTQYGPTVGSRIESIEAKLVQHLKVVK